MRFGLTAATTASPPLQSQQGAAPSVPLNLQVLTPGSSGKYTAQQPEYQIIPGSAPPAGGFSVDVEHSAPAEGTVIPYTDVGLSEFLGDESGGFWEKHKAKIMIGGGLGVAAIAAFLIMRRK